MTLTAQSITVEKIGDIRNAINLAWLKSCGTLAKADNGVISPEEAVAELTSILAPLQISIALDDEDAQYDDPCEPHERWTEKEMAEADYRMDEMKDRQMEGVEA